MDYFFKNAEADELVFVDKGEGVLQSNLGYIKFGKGDYIIIPRNTIYRLEFDTSVEKVPSSNS
jgi:Homogentisate 1,2-dioxygenase